MILLLCNPLKSHQKNFIIFLKVFLSSFPFKLARKGSYITFYFIFISTCSPKRTIRTTISTALSCLLHNIFIQDKERFVHISISIFRIVRCKTKFKFYKHFNANNLLVMTTKISGDYAELFQQEYEKVFILPVNITKLL